MLWEHYKREIRKTIAVIEDSCQHEGYIFRGEPKKYDRPCSSTLWREYAFGDIGGFAGEMPENFRENIFKNLDLNKVQEQILSEAKEYRGDIHDDFEVLSYLRHHGGLTNLIDFTSNLHIALFFACSDCVDEDGHLYIQDVDLVTEWVKYPKNINPRVMGQKSIFVQHPQGFLEPTKDIPIPKNIKSGLKEYLARYFDVNAKTVYYDLAGFIQNFSIRKSLNDAVETGMRYTGMRYKWQRNRQGRKTSGRYDDLVIDIFGKVITYDPTVHMAYSSRGIAFYNKGEYDAAIEEFTKAIDIFPSDGNLSNRGLAYFEKGDYEKSISDFSKSLDIFPSDRLYVIRGDVYRKMGEHGKAERDYTKAKNACDDEKIIQTRGNWILVARYKLAILNLLKNKYKAALREINEVIEQDNQEFFALYQCYCVRGVALLCLGKWKEAPKDFVKCQKKNKNIDLLLEKDFQVISSFLEERSINPPLNIKKILGMD